MVDTPRAEPRDVSSRALYLTGAAIAAFILAVVVMLWLIYEKPQPSMGSAEIESAALQEVTGEKDRLRRFQADEETRLETLGWVDRSKGLAHIPIETAMDEIAEHGVPAWLGHGDTNRGVGP